MLLPPDRLLSLSRVQLDHLLYPEGSNDDSSPDRISVRLSRRLFTWSNQCQILLLYTSTLTRISVWRARVTVREYGPSSQREIAVLVLQKQQLEAGLFSSTVLVIPTTHARSWPLLMAAGARCWCGLCWGKFLQFVLGLLVSTLAV